MVNLAKGVLALLLLSAPGAWPPAAHARQDTGNPMRYGPVTVPNPQVKPSRRGQSTDTWAVTKPVNGLKIQNTIIQASARCALHFYKGRGPFKNVTLDNCLITVAPSTLHLDRSLWAFRGYDMMNTVLRRVEISDFGKVTRMHDEGHAIYLNVAGDLTLDHCHIQRNGGQGLQLVNRPGESMLPRGPARGRITIRNTRFAENGYNPDRAGSQVSIFGTGQEILILNTVIEAGYQPHLWPQRQTGGALLIEAEANDPSKPNKPVWWSPQRVGAPIPFAQRDTVLQGVTVRHVNPNRPLVSIKGCQSLYVTQSHFEGGKIELDHPRKPGRDCGRVVWRNNTGDAEVYHRGKHIGRASDSFTLYGQ